jgi:hypothetical protein
VKTALTQPTRAMLESLFAIGRPEAERLNQGDR